MFITLYSSSGDSRLSNLQNQRVVTQIFKQGSYQEMSSGGERPDDEKKGTVRLTAKLVSE
jgi:hypothetical protein